MAYSTRYSSKSKDDENNNRRSGSSASDANDLKSSARNTPLRTSLVPSEARKYELLLKRISPTNTKRRKFKMFELPKMPSPMRRSERINKNSPLMTEDFAHKCKTDSFRFVEYWLPVQISQVQLEQYCSTLVSNASVLQSSSKNDRVGALRDLLISTRKCCNHPYVVDPLLQTVLTEGLQAVEYLDIGIKASGKLQVLDSMLMELKKKGLRVLILFQSVGGSGKDFIGDILDDFLYQRFGSDAYERVDKGVLRSKKLAALNLFNSNGSGRFIFLLEACACFPSIKLSSVNIIIIFNSDWNPVNDIRSLQKITLDSQSQQIKIFRLYSCFTVEEKALILAKQGKTLDSNLQNISWSISHMLLMWGSSCLFGNLRLTHDGKNSSSCFNYSFEDPGQLSKEALHEFSTALLQDSEYNDTSNCSIILKVQLNEGTYCTNFALLGEKKLGSPDEGLPHMFWTELLKEKVPQWRHSCGSSQRKRQRAYQVGGSVNTPNSESEEISKKCRKVINSVADEPPSNFQGEKSSTGDEEGDKVGYEKKILCDEQKSLHLSLMPEIAKLCEILLLPNNVKTVVDNFLEYIMNHHHISSESESILQAFQISLCWTAASLLKHKINHKISLMLAREHLKFDCKKEEADYMYSMLRCLKEIFLHRAGNSDAIGFSDPSKSPNKVYSCTGVAPEVELAMKDIAKSIKEIEKKCQKKLRKLLLKQDEEKNKLHEGNEEKKAAFRGKFKIELAVINFCFSNDAMRSEKLKVLDKEFAERIEDLECQHGILLKDLEAVQLEARKKFQCWEAAWIEQVKHWAQDELKIFLSKEFGSGLKCSRTSDQAQPHDGSYGGSIPRNDGHIKAESVYENQGHIISMLSYSKEHNSNGDTDGEYEGDGQNNSSHSCRDDLVYSVIPSSEGKICDGKTWDASIQEMAVIKRHNTSQQVESMSTHFSSVPVTQTNPDSLLLNSLQQVQTLHSAESPKSNRDIPEEVQNFSQEIELLSNPVDAVLPNHSSHESLVMEPLMQEQQLPTSESPSSNQDIVEETHNPSPQVGQVIANQDLVKGLLSVEHPSSNENTVEKLQNSSQQIGSVSCPVEEVQNFSQKVELLPIPADVVLPKQSNGESQVMEPLMQEQQSPTSESPSNQDIVEEMHNPSLQDGQAMANQDPVKGLLSVEHPSSNENTVEELVCCPVEEVQNVSEEVEPPSNPVDVVLPNQSIRESQVTEPLTQEQQSPTSDSPSYQDIDEEMHNSSQQDGQVMPNQDPMKGLLSVEHPFNENTVAEQVCCPVEKVQSFSQEVEPLSNPVDIVLLNQSNGESQVVEPLMQEQQSPSSDSPSPGLGWPLPANLVGKNYEFLHQVDSAPHARADSVTMVVEPLEHAQQVVSVELPSSNLHLDNLPLAPTTEDQRINEVTVSTLIPQAIDEVPNQVVVQLNPMTPTGGITHLSNTINRSTPEIISQPIQTATQSASSMPPPLYVDPLQIETEKIRNETYQAVKDHENMKLQLKADYEKELKEVLSKYDMKLQEIEVEHQQRKNNLDASINKARATMTLAEVIRSKCWGPKLIDAKFAKQLVQLDGEQSAVRSSLVVASSSMPPATTLQSAFAMPRSQLMATPIQSSYGTTGNFSNVSARRPQVVSNFHDLAPCPQLLRSLTSVPTTTSHHPNPLRGMPHRPAPSNIPATSFSFPQLPPQPTPPTSQVDPRNRGLWPFSFYGMNGFVDAANQFGLNLPNVRPHM